MEAAGKYGDRVKLVLAVLAFPPPQELLALRSYSLLGRR